MAIGFDDLTSRPASVNFDWIPQSFGNLEAGRIQKVRRDTLADIGEPGKDAAGQPVSRSDLYLRAGQKLFAAGDFDGAMKMLAEGRQLKQAETAEFSQKQWLEYLNKNKPSPLTGTGLTDERHIPGDPFFPAHATPAGGGRRPGPSALTPVSL